MSEAQALRADTAPSQMVARRVRGLLAEGMLSGSKMAVMIGLDQRAFSRRYRGEVSWSIDELAAIADALRIPFVELVDVVRQVEVETPAAPGGGQAFLPLGEGLGAPSGTRTPNPLTRDPRERDEVAARRTRRHSTPTRPGRPAHVASNVRTPHLYLVVDEEAS